jgi:hypothetical protein
MTVSMVLRPRGIKRIELQEGRTWSLEELRDRAFLPWYLANRFLKEGQSEDDYWFECIEAFDAVKSPLGVSPLEQAWRAAEAATVLPPVASQFSDPEVRQLILWCQELQRQAGDAPFYLSCRSVQARFGLSSPPRASQRLHGLVRMKILDPVEVGGPKTMKATRYRYLPPLEAPRPADPPEEAGPG